MSPIVLVVQHWEKEQLAEDPGLTPLGRVEAEATAARIVATVAPVAIWAGPAQRMIETAARSAG